VAVVAVTPDGRVISGGRDGRVLVWVPTTPGAPPIELGRHGSDMYAVAVAPNGWARARAVSGSAVRAVAVVPDGRVISAGADRVLLWDPRHPGVGVEIVGATATAIAIAPGCSHDQPRLVISHSGHGISMWALPQA
jgi:hypothetical protein